MLNLLGLFLRNFLGTKIIIFVKSLASPAFEAYDLLTSCRISEKPVKLFLRATVN